MIPALAARSGLALVLVVAACGGGHSGQPTAAEVTVDEIAAGGQLRSYRLFTPPALDRRRPVPLVLVLHGAGGSAESMVRATQFDPEASRTGFLVAYPDGLEGVWNAGICCGRAPASGVDDTGFLVSLLDRLEVELPVDPARVFVAGFSNGAMMAYRFACERPDRVTAVASMAGTMDLDTCHPSAPVSVIAFHGRADPVVAYGGGPLGPAGGTPAPSAPAVAARWAEIDSCPGPAATAVAGPVTTSSWVGCRAGTAVRLVTVDGAGHHWFGPGLGSTEGAVDATTAAWEFFSRLRR